MSKTQNPPSSRTPDPVSLRSRAADADVRPRRPRHPRQSLARQELPSTRPSRPEAPAVDHSPGSRAELSSHAGSSVPDEGSGRGSMADVLALVYRTLTGLLIPGRPSPCRSPRLDRRDSARPPPRPGLWTCRSLRVRVSAVEGLCRCVREACLCSRNPGLSLRESASLCSSRRPSTCRCARNAGLSPRKGPGRASPAFLHTHRSETPRGQSIRAVRESRGAELVEPRDTGSESLPSRARVGSFESVTSPCDRKPQPRDVRDVSAFESALGPARRGREERHGRARKMMPRPLISRAWNPERDGGPALMMLKNK